MPTPIAMPKLGITMEEGTVVEWPYAVGDRVEKGKVVLIIESEKAEIEIEAAEAGVIRHYYVESGDTVPCGTLLAAVTEGDDDSFDVAAFESAHAEETAANAGAAPARKPTRPAVRAATPAPSRRPGTAPATPAARVLARALEVDISRVTGTGPGGRILREDVGEWAERRKRLIAVADDVSLDVPQHGDGTAVLLLPGLGTDVSAFAQQIPTLAADHRVYGVNPRGVAGSDAPEQDSYSVAQAASDAAAVCEGSVHVIGASLGAAVALEFALTQPKRVRSLTLITPFVVSDARLDAVSDSWSRLAGDVAPDVLARSLLPWFFSAEFLADDGRRERIVRGLGTTVSRVPAATLHRAVAGLRDWSGTRSDDLAKLAVPTLVIAAGGDLLTPNAEAIAAPIPGATLVVVPNAGHAVTIEAPEAVNEALLAHVRAAS
ncbi:MAG: alpha/beta fold hydrolase [Candidatus Binatia bacterium]|nr:alpha/beta fold hydrolase [Candidatus Binatia bacterium]